MKQIINIKRGDTVPMSAVVTNDDGTPKDLTGYTIRCQVRDANYDLIYEFSGLSIFTPAGGTVPNAWSFTPANSNLWPIALLQSDILYEINGSLFHTATFYLNCKVDITA